MLRCKLHHLFWIIFPLVSAFHCHMTQAVRVDYEALGPIESDNVSCVQRSFEQSRLFGPTRYSKTDENLFGDKPRYQSISANLLTDPRLSFYVTLGPLENGVRSIQLSGSTPFGTEKNSTHEERKIMEQKIADAFLGLQNHITIECEDDWKELKFTKTVKTDSAKD